jgi:UDP-N-acetylmuramoyl-L-alanyl-D-glutamate--2,6-diaminopimelate ligase
MIAYRAAKSRIVRHLKPGGLLVINADDSGAQSCLPALAAEPQQIMTFGIQADADLQAEILEETLLGTRLQLRHGLESSRAFVPLAGRHNVENVLAAVAAVRHFGFGLAEIAEVLPRCTSAPGRLQTVPTQGQFHLFVDYAHTPDAIARVVHTVRELTFGKVIVVCGAGGDRDKSKRPEMGRAAAAADVVIFTADNPRSEDPARIIAEMQTGVPAHSCETMIELDRRQAIELAIGRAEPGDAVLILGKGHEREQVIGTTRLPFDDVVEAQQAVKRVRQSSLK